MDFATIFGSLLAWGALVGALLMEGGDLHSLINIPAALLVFGGTLAAATVSFKMSQITGLPGTLRQAFTKRTNNIATSIASLLRFAERERHKGLLVLDAEPQ